MNKKLDKYQKWLQIIFDEVLDLSFSEEVWNTLTKIEKRSSHFKKYGGHLQLWIDKNYTYKVIVQIAKICDPKANRKDDMNLTLFLSKLKEKQYISFEKFLATYKKAPIKEEERKILYYYGNTPLYELTTTIEDVQKNFKEITGYSHKRTDFSIMINKDINQVKEVFNIIETFRHKKIVHLTRTDADKIPTYGDIKKCIKILKKIVKKYYLI